MKGVNTESTNTDRMRQHQILKNRVAASTLAHEDVDLMMCTDLVDTARTSVLNGSTDRATVLQVLGANPNDLALVSDVDPQLLVKVVFKEKVNISSISLRFNAPPRPSEDSEDADQTYSKPKLIKIFGNKEDLDFGDQDSIKPAAQIVVDDRDQTEAKASSVGHKFQRLDSMQLLVQEAFDDDADRTFINRLSLVGHQAPTYHS